MTDAKVPDAQYGAEKGISSLAAALAGGNLIYESSGMMASLLGASFEAFILDDEMHSLIYRTLRGVEVNEETLGYEAIREAVLGPGHFLGGAHTIAAMQRDYFYPSIADRDAPVTWDEKGRPDAWTRAKTAARKVLDTHHPSYLSPEAEARIRAEFPIRLEAPMTPTYLKRGEAAAAPAEAVNLSGSVAALLMELETGREPTAQRLSAELDRWQGDIVVSDEAIAAACARVPQRLKDDIAYAHENIARFAQAQRDSIRETEVELRPGLTAGQRLIPVNAAGCYVPGGRYSHIASAMMTVTTAKVAGVQHIAAVSPPRADAPAGVPDAILYTLHHCGADRVLALGGIQGVAALAFGLFGLPAADILVGPGNQYVAEAKRLLYGRVGIDMVAGPTDSMVIADATADPAIVAWDLIGQAEHGANSPVWLVTDSAALAAEVARLAPLFAAELPQPNRAAAEAAWAALGEIILCDGPEAMAATADRIAPEHLHVQAANLDWWKSRLSAYGSLFLGAESTVAFGDKAAGTNHVLPTSGAARYTGGLSVHKFLKTVTWQKVTTEALPQLAAVTASISRFEGMEGHARTADIRLEKFLR